jgi:hypothetical protein
VKAASEAQEALTVSVAPAAYIVVLEGSAWDG